MVRPYTYNPAVQDTVFAYVSFWQSVFEPWVLSLLYLLSNLALCCVRCCEYVLESKRVQTSTDRLQYNDFLYSPCMTLHCAHSTHVKPKQGVADTSVHKAEWPTPSRMKTHMVWQCGTTTRLKPV
eukprot:SAG22_NODE_4_length_44774_cov_362.122149_17_plen_125_part_00